MNFKSFLFTFIACLLITQAYTQNTLDYDWKNVKIGGGGYITGMKVHPQDPNIIYLRTDVGGAYRWNPATQEVEQIINFRNGNYYGVAGIALHPTNKNIVYLAVDRGNTASNSAILKSTNRGDTWQVIPTDNFKFGANGGRNNSDTDDRDREGSPIAVNPNDANELWVGSREKGLWRLNGTSWTRIAAGTIPDNNLENSIRNVLFHPTDANYIYVGYYNYGIYRSSNGGASFSPINGGNNKLRDVSDLSFSKNGTKLYAACRNNGVFKLNNPLTSTNWTNTNIGDANVNWGYLTVTASPHNDNIVVACPAGTGGNNFARLHVSYDSGNTWTKKNNATSVTIFNWNQNNGKGLHTGQLAFDSANPNKLYFTSWSGLWYTSNWQANQVAWSNDMSYGHEEIVNTGLTAFPPNNNGTVLGANSADHAGWIITDPDNYPSEDIKDLTTPSGSYIKGAGTAICEQFPANIVVSSTRNWKDSDGYILYSTDAGQSFSRANGYQTAWGKANVAIAQRNPNNIVVVCSAGVKYSTDRGATFNNANDISGVSATNSVFFSHRPLVADAVANNTFYIYNRNNAKVYRSTNNGQNWSERGTIPDNFKLTNESNSTRLAAAPGREGHLWINHKDKGLYRSTNGGGTWNKINNVSKAIAMSIGKEKTPGGYPTIYILGRLSGQSQSWIYRSTDQGATWEQISDDSTLFLEARIRHMAADRSEFGKVYISASGMGVWSGSADAMPPPPAEFINITAPTQGESIPKGSIYDIRWNDNLPGDVRVVLFKDGNYDRTLASSVPSNGSYAWTVANDIPAGNNYRIRIRSNDNGNIDDYSENFSIENACPAANTPCDDGNPDTVNDREDGNCNCAGDAAEILIRTQADGNDVEKGTSHNILWTTNLPGDMRIVLFKDGNYDRIIESAASNNYLWTVANDIPAGDNYSIRVRSNTNPDIDDFSQDFSIVEPATLGCDLIPNGTFENGDLSGWEFKQNGGASGTYSSPWNRAQLSIDNAGTAVWHLSLRHDDITLKGGKTYELKYEAKAWGDRNMSVFVQHKNNNYATLYSQVVPLENAWNLRPTATFTMPSNGEVVISFRLGTNNKTVILDNITLNEVGCSAAKKDESYSPDIQLFPNPTTHTIHLNTELSDHTSADVFVYDAFGKMVKNLTAIELTAGLQTLDIDISDLSAGMYFFTLQSDNWQAVERFVIVR